MLLEHKRAVIYGPGGVIGGAVARAFAREGARLFLVGRTLAKLDAVARYIAAGGGAAETAEVDALDAQSVGKYIAAVVEKAGGIDVSFNAIRIEDVQGTPLIEMSLEEFSRSITIARGRGASASSACVRPDRRSPSPRCWIFTPPVTALHVTNSSLRSRT